MDRKSTKHSNFAFEAYLSIPTTDLNDSCMNELAMVDLLGLVSSENMCKDRSGQSLRTAKSRLESKFTPGKEQLSLNLFIKIHFSDLEIWYGSIGFENRCVFEELFKFWLHCQFDCSLPIRLLVVQNTSLNDPDILFEI